MDITDFEQTLSRYIAERLADAQDGAHDHHHLYRVAANARHIQQQEGGDLRVIIAAAWLHDIVQVPKNHPDRCRASRMAADEAVRILQTRFPAFPATLHAAVFHAVEAHSFSAGITAETLEAQVVQDADRLDSLGALGVARVFYVAGLMSRPLFEPQDPFATARPLDDQRYTLDHFRVKVMRLPELMNTAEGRRIAETNASWMIDFLSKLAGEIDGEPLQASAWVREHFARWHPWLQ
ncbi:HD domain-containing protein [Musicola paradisiaca]|uniref:Metal dependent phosphohydrolase n=1 Tax=Musicola paradisiaca (strain Ech703) TaxID=579405 RepID=C6C3F4_MUSP7|nr:HD domain-containing protein [Musicola paradisiaca]ACS87252.1 metal dependent phosphohydrolase [Musicola paradisiaca Ech703]